MRRLVVFLVISVVVAFDVDIEDAPLKQLPQGTVRGFFGITAGGRAFATFHGIPYAQPPVGDLRYAPPPPPPPPPMPTVQIRQGFIRGTYEWTNRGRTISAYRGIPYAQPPIGWLRFQQSVPASAWSGVYDATRAPNECLQYSHATYKVEGSEDCLYANVYVPEIPNRQTPLEVIIYIHGGAFMFLSSNVYQPHYLLDKDVILVTFNYRLGALGFLSTEDEVLPGNLGLKDQLLLLKWVNQNIEYFGGDPKKVTITGMSAGGASVHYHLLSPLSRGLFHNAISMSGTALCPWTQAENMREKAFLIGNAVGCNVGDSASLVNCLKTKPAEDIVASVKMFQPWLYSPFSPLGPVVEPPGPNAFVTRSPIDNELLGQSTDVPWLVSITKNEGLYPGAEIITDENYMAALSQNWNDIAPSLLDYNYTVDPHYRDDVSKAIWKQYFGTEGLKPKKLIKLLSDRLFDVCVEHGARIHAQVYKSPVYVYLFSYRGERSLSDIFGKKKLGYGVSHADDTGYILSSYYMNHTSSPDIKMKDIMTEMWSSFAKTSVPSFGPYKGPWVTLKEGLPEFTHLDILSPEAAELESPAVFSPIDFWESLNLWENIPSTGVPNPKEEL